MLNQQNNKKGTSKILVSACLLGQPVRYDARSKAIASPDLDRLQKLDRIIAFCPEMAGGLPTPRPPAEVQSGRGDQVLSGKTAVKTEAGEDLSQAFIAGASKALELCQQYRITLAILTEYSPSCGSSMIYDGKFQRQAIPGFGVTTALLRQNRIQVFSQHEIHLALEVLAGQD